MDVVRDFRRGAVRLHVLHHAAEGEVSGVWMSAELARHGYRISPGTLYPMLHALEAAMLLTSAERTENGRVLRYYTATAAGLAALASAREALAELARELLSSPGRPHRPGRNERADDQPC
jgi:DNA-binding PadR family transcriptional regulator